MATGKRPFEGAQPGQPDRLGPQGGTGRRCRRCSPWRRPCSSRSSASAWPRIRSNRWQTAGDLKRALQWIVDGGSQVGVPVTVSRRRKRREAVLWGALAAGRWSPPAGWAARPGAWTVSPCGWCAPTSSSPTAPSCWTWPAAWPSCRPTAPGWPTWREDSSGGRPPAVGALPGRAGGRAPAGHRVRPVPLLVARQPLRRLLRRRQAEEDPGHGRSGPDALRSAVGPRRQLEQRRRDHLHAVVDRRRPPGGGGGRPAYGGHRARHHLRRRHPPLAPVPARRRTTSSTSRAPSATAAANWTPSASVPSRRRGSCA